MSLAPNFVVCFPVWVVITYNVQTYNVQTYNVLSTCSLGIANNRGIWEVPIKKAKIQLFQIDGHLPQQQRRIAAYHGAGYAESLVNLDVVRQLEWLDFRGDCL